MFSKRKLSKQSPTEILPSPLLLLMLNYCGADTASRAMAVNKQWHSFILKANSFWQIKYKMHFPSFYVDLKNPQAINWHEEFFGQEKKYETASPPLHYKFLFSLIKERDFEKLKEYTRSLGKILIQTERVRKNEIFFLDWAQLRNDQYMLDFFYHCIQEAAQEKEEGEANIEPNDPHFLHRWAIECRQDVSIDDILSPGALAINVIWAATTAVYSGHLNLLQELYKKHPGVVYLSQTGFLIDMARLAAYSGSLPTLKFIIEKFPPANSKAILKIIFKCAFTEKPPGKGSIFPHTWQLNEDFKMIFSNPPIEIAIEVAKGFLQDYYQLLANESSLIHQAIRYNLKQGRPSIAQLLLNFRLEFFSTHSTVDSQLLSPLYIIENERLIYSAIEKDDSLAVRYLLELGSDVNKLSLASGNMKKTQTVSPVLSNTQEEEYSTPLLFAACNNRQRIMQILLQRGANIKVAFDYALAQKKFQAAITLLQTIEFSFSGKSVRELLIDEQIENKNRIRKLIIGYADDLQQNSTFSSHSPRLFEPSRIRQAAFKLKKIFLEEEADSSLLESLRSSETELTFGKLGNIYRLARQFFPEKALPSFNNVPSLPSPSQSLL